MTEEIKLCYHRKKDELEAKFNSLTEFERLLINEIEDELGIPRHSILLKRRSRDMADARAILFTILRLYNRRHYSLPYLAENFVLGGLDHTTIINNLKVFKDVLIEDDYYLDVYRTVLRKFNILGETLTPNQFDNKRLSRFVKMKAKMFKAMAQN
jgi:chromosomal replication initiation ATPase DnaA